MKSPLNLRTPACLFATLMLIKGINANMSSNELSTSQAEPDHDSIGFDFERERYLASKEITCTTDADCPNPPYFFCGLNRPGLCDHKKLFPPTGLEVGGWFVFAFVKAISNVAGIGGGSVSVPIIMAMFFFDTKKSVAISSFAIFVTSLTAFLLNFRKRHPEKPNVVVIDYPLVTIMMPLVLAGSQVGGLILVLFPALAIQIMLIIMLLALLVQVVFQAIDITKKENAAIRAKMTKPENVPRSKVVPIHTTEADEKEEKSEIELMEQSQIRIKKVEPETEPVKLVTTRP